jgi:tRNA(fMet)-specific endonuclease VapC
MKKILLDTNAYVAFKNGKEDAVNLIQLAENIGITVIVLGELLAGFVIGGKEAQNRQELNDFLDSPRVSLLLIDDETTEFYARIFRQLRIDGMPIPTNDLWIAATALQHGYAVFTYDKHFGAVNNLITCQSSSDILP